MAQEAVHTVAAGSTPQGGLDVRLDLAAGEVRRVAIDSRRPLAAARVFVGKAPEQVPRLARRLFAVCGHAQGVAALTALEAARGRVPGAATLAGRAAVLQAELAREHLTRILAGWSPALERPIPSRSAARARALPGEVEAAAFPAGGLLAPGGSAAGPWRWQDLVPALEETLSEVLGISPAAFLGLDSPGALVAYLEGQGDRAVGPAYLAQLRDRGWAGLGSVEVTGLPSLDPSALESLLAGPQAGAFVARPEWAGRPRETGPLVRAWEWAPVAAARAGFGHGVLTRSVARLAELAAVPGALRRLAAGQGMPEIAAASPAAGVGLGAVPAARGWLVHRSQLGSEGVAGYRILAPTEWNFHPDGPVSRGLVGHRFADGQAAAEAAACLIGSIDPCVDYTLELAHA